MKYLHYISRFLGSLALLLSLYSSQAQDDFLFDPVWEDNVFPHNPYSIQFDKLERPYFYVASDNGGVAIYENQLDTDPSFLYRVNISEWNNLKVMDITQQGNYVFAALGSIFEVGDQDYGIAIIDVTDPLEAQVTDYWQKGVPNNGSAIIRVQGDYVYLGAMKEGLFILDISDKNEIKETAHYIPNKDWPIENPNTIQDRMQEGCTFKMISSFFATMPVEFGLLTSVIKNCHPKFIDILIQIY